MKGQYFSFDAIIASVIFVLALVALLSYWHSVRSFLDFQSDSLSKDALKLSNLLFAPSYPSSECDDIERLGFAMSWSEHKINQSIITCAEGKDMAWLQEKMGTGNGISISVTNLADNSVTRIGGDQADIDAADNIVKIRRLATVADENGDTYLAKIDLWMFR